MSPKLKKSVVSALILTILYIAIPFPALAEYQIVEKNAMQDTFVTESSTANTVSSYEHLEASASTWTYITFDMSDIKYLNYKAVLHLTLKNVVPSGTTAKAGVYGVMEQDFTFGDISGENRPELLERLGEVEFEVDIETELDVTRYVREKVSKRGNIAFAVVQDNGAGQTLVLYASESERGPRLTIDRNNFDPALYEMEPEPAQTLAPTSTPEIQEEAAVTQPPRAEREYFVPEPNTSGIPPGTDIDMLTTTRTAPWMVNYHLTKLQQAEHGYKGGECGQFMFCVDIAPSDPAKMMTGFDTCNVRKSENSGAEWLDASNGLKSMGTIDIRFDPDNSNIAYLAACPHSGNEAYNQFSGIWKTEDGGKNWYQLNDFQFPTLYNGYVLEFGNKNTEGIRPLYAGVYNMGVMRSEDGGRTWTNMGLTEKKITSLQIFNNRILVTSRNGVFSYEKDAWRQCSNGLESTDITGIAVDPKDSEHWFAVDKEHIYESVDDGVSWSVLHTKESAGLTTGSFMSIHFNRASADEDAILYIICTSQTYSIRYSTDYGRTLELPEFAGRETVYLEDNHGWFAEAFRVHPVKSNECLASMDGELHKGIFEDGKLRLYPSSSGISGIRASDFTFSFENPKIMFIAAIDRGVIKTVDVGGNEEYPLVYNLPFEDRYNIRFSGSKTSTALAIDPRNPDRVICNVGTWQKSVLKESLNGGMSYVELLGTESSPPKCIAFHQSNPDIIYAGQVVSYDNGNTWMKSKIKIEAVSPHNSDIVYGASGDKVYVSYNCARDWECFNQTVISGMQRIRPDLTEEGKLYVGTFLNGFWILTGNAAKHITDENGLVKSAGDKLPIMDIAQDPQNPLHLLAGGVDNYVHAVSAGLFESLDGGESWRVVDGITGSKDIWVIEFHPTRPLAFIGTSAGTFVYEYDNYFDREKTAFLDVTEEDIYINALAAQGWISGYPDGTFQGQKKLARAEFAAFIAPFVQDGSVGKRFEDIPDGAWFSGVVNKISAADVMNGFDGRFRPEELVTHEEAMTAIAKLLPTSTKKGYSLAQAKSALEEYEIADYAIYSVYKCLKNGIFNLDDADFKFVPKNKLTRSEAAVLMYRVKEVLKIK